MTNSDYKLVQIRLPKPIYEAFFRAFPGRGERSLLVTRFIQLAIEMAPKKDAFIEAVLEEARERSG